MSRPRRGSRRARQEVQMLGKVRPRRPSAAMVVAFLALCVALSGTAVGKSAVTSAQKLITGKQIKNRSVTGVDIKSNSLTSGAIKNQSLVRADFRLGELPVGPAGAKGDVGAQGPQGPKGDPGTNGSPDTPQQVLAKLEQVDGSGSGLDADNVDGTDATVLLQDAGVVVLGGGAGPPQLVGTATPGFNVTSVPADTCAAQSSFGIAGLEVADFLLVERQSPPTSGVLDSFRIGEGPNPQVAYAVCNTTDAAIDPPQAVFRVIALR